MKFNEQYFRVLLFIMLYEVAQTFKSVDKTLVLTIHVKAIEQYFHLLLAIQIKILTRITFEFV